MFGIWNYLGTVWVARGDSSTWTQNNPKFRPSAVRKKSLKFD
jgi:hypothetical protein